MRRNTILWLMATWALTLALAVEPVWASAPDDDKDDSPGSYAETVDPAKLPPLGEVVHRFRGRGWSVTVDQDPEATFQYLRLWKGKRVVLALWGYRFSFDVHVPGGRGKGDRRFVHREFRPGKGRWLAVLHSTLGTACCERIYLIDPAQARIVDTVGAEGVSSPGFAQLDRRPGLEAYVDDRTLVMWNGSCAACAPLPRIALAWTPKGYQPSSRVQRGPRPSQREIAKIRRELKIGLGYDTRTLDGFAWPLVDLVYSGHGRLAWSLAREVWRTNTGERESYLEALRDAMARSPFWPVILRANGISVKTPGAAEAFLK
jgi:hypothetical protein